MIKGLLSGRDGDIAKVTKTGELVVGPIAYNDSFFRALAVNDQVYNFLGPRPDKRFVIHSLGGRAGFGVSTTQDATLIIYEGASSGASTVDKVLYEDLVLRASVIAIAGVNILVNPGVWVNAKIDDAPFSLTLWGYYINEIT